MKSVSEPYEFKSISSRDAARRRARLNAWFSTSVGQSIAAAESQHLGEVLSRLYGTFAVQLGAAGSHDYFGNCNAPRRVLVEPAKRAVPDGVSLVIGVPEMLPLETRSVDIVLMPHTLEFADDPHQVLREANRVLTPEGHLIVLGFNPISLWGAARLVNRRRRAPWQGQFYQLLRVKDWLKLLEFEVREGAMLYYRPPVRRERLRERLRFMERMGNRWWPMAGAVYCLVARKRVVGMTPIRPAWKSRRLIGGVAVRPVARAAHLRVVKPSDRD